MGREPTGPRILVHLPNWLGDVVMSTPLLDLLSTAFAAVDAQQRPVLHAAVNRPWSALFAEDPRLAGLLVLDRGGRHGGLGGIGRQARDFQAGRYDAVLLGPPSLRAGLAAFFSGTHRRIGHATDGRGFFLTSALPRGPRGARHYSYEMLDLGLATLAEMDLPLPFGAAGGGDDAPDRPVALPVPSLPGCDSIQPLAGPFVRPLWLVAPGTTYGEAKTWPQAQVAEFLDLAAGESGAQVVLLGDSGAAAFVAELRAGSRLVWGEQPGRDHEVVDLTGRTNLGEVVAIMKSASAFVGNDSGLMHLAGALGLPTVGVFGSSNPEWTHPLGRFTSAVTARGFACRPCYRRTCNQAVFCLTTVEPAAVLAEVQRLGIAASAGSGDPDTAGRPTGGA